jgi:hypothetical protein
MFMRIVENTLKMNKLKETVLKKEKTIDGQLRRRSNRQHKRANRRGSRSMFMLPCNVWERMGEWGPQSWMMIIMETNDTPKT